MNVLDAHRWVDVLGWTLFHSLWQGLLIVLLLFVIRRTVCLSATLFYAVSTTLLLLVLISSIGTFMYLLPGNPDGLPAEVSTSGITGQGPFSWNAEPVSIWFTVTVWVNNHLPMLVACWLIGMVFFGSRLVLAWWQSVRLRKSGDRLVGFWEHQLHELACQLGIYRTILLCQSARVDAPVLLGYLKPVILLPIGMMSGLSNDQIETILLHELAHIRRYDYAVNFTQSLIEVVFFFNPFVWILSSHIRKDREQCCDDLVVQFRSPLTYARALHQLAKVQTLGTPFSLGVAGTKNQLLQRIQRIMKTHEKKEENRGKMVPAVVVLCALATASWLSIQAYRPSGNPELLSSSSASQHLIPVDTSKKNLKENKLTTEDSKAVVEGEANEAGADEIREPGEDPAVWATPPDFDIAIPEIPEMPEIPEIPSADFPALAELNEQLSIMNFDLSLGDTLPNGRLDWNNGRDWEEWGKEFTKKFSERFSEFYEKNRPEFEKMMKEFEEKLGRMEINHRWDLTVDAHKSREMHRMAERFSRLAPRQEEMMRAKEETMRRMEHDMHRRHEDMALKMQDMQSHLKTMERNREAFERELRKQLVKDGYLGKDEKINSLKFGDDDTVTINGKKIKEADRGKYQDLRRKHFRRGGHFGIVE